MNKNELFEKTEAIISETKEALEAVYSELNNGQHKKLVKEEKIKNLFDRYGVEYTE